MDITMNEMLKKLPGGENLYIANNGHIREKTAQQLSFQMSLQNHVPRVPMPRIQASAPPQPQPIYFASERGATRYTAQDPTLRHTNPVPGFRHSFTAQPIPEASLQKFHALGPVHANTTHDGSIVRYSLPPPPPPSVTAPAIPYPAPTSWSSMTLLPTSLGPPGSVPLCSSQVNQTTSLPPVPGDHNLDQADLVVASQANLQQHPAGSDQQLQEQQQGQQLPEQPQQQEVVTSEPVSDL